DIVNQVRGVMVRRRQAQRLQTLLVRLRNAGFQGILREAFQLPASFAQPVSKLAAVLRIPPALLWAALTTLLGCTVFALSWILTALILNVIQPRDICEERINKLHEDIPDEDADHYLLPHQGKRKPSTAINNNPESFDGDPGSFRSWPLDDGADGVDEAEAIPEDDAVSTDAQSWPTSVSVTDNRSHASAWPLASTAVSEEPPAVLYLPYLDEQEAADVRQCVSRCASVIPVTAFEAARCCEAVFDLGLDAGGYRRLLLSEVAVPAQGKQEIKTLTDEESATLPAEGAAALGRLALHSHLGRYLYGVHSGSLCGDPQRHSDAAVEETDVQAVAADAAAGRRREEVMPPRRQRSGAGPSAKAACAAAEATLHDIATFARPEVLAGLARRLRLDLLLCEPQHPGSAASSASRQSEGSRMQSLGRMRLSAAARGGSGAAGAGPPSTTALAAALLRLVWEAHVAAPGRAWLAVCVLAGLARELRLVGRGV
ncbi:hypothetical protein Vafri_11213, partial [Volvox africanus]